ncbi:MAG: hypothetical protein IKV25_02845 [Clostridia bacterium]|nr:hypothetical protein [Clostridia bacterium]
MRELTEERIIEIMKKHREFIFGDIEKNLCLEHYNLLNRQNLTKNDVDFRKAYCPFCSKEKLCVITKHN